VPCALALAAGALGEQSDFMAQARERLGGCEDIGLRSAKASKNIVDKENFHFRLFSAIE